MTDPTSHNGAAALAALRESIQLALDTEGPAGGPLTTEQLQAAVDYYALNYATFPPGRLDVLKIVVAERSPSRCRPDRDAYRVFGRRPQGDARRIATRRVQQRGPQSCLEFRLQTAKQPASRQPDWSQAGRGPAHESVRISVSSCRPAVVGGQPPPGSTGAPVMTSSSFRTIS